MEVVLRPWGAPPGDPDHDAAALAAAWVDPEVARWTAVPSLGGPAAAGRTDGAAGGADPEVAGDRAAAGLVESAAAADRVAAGQGHDAAVRARRAAARWIAGEGERRARGLALDFVIGSPDDEGRQVLGEVGLTRFDDAGRAELGFWLAPAARGRGLATAAVTVLARWALTPGDAGPGLRRVWARTDPRNERAARVLVRAGFQRRGEAGGSAARSTVWTLDAASLRP